MSRELLRRGCQVRASTLDAGEGAERGGEVVVELGEQRSQLSVEAAGVGVGFDAVGDRDDLPGAVDRVDEAEGVEAEQGGAEGRSLCAWAKPIGIPSTSLSNWRHHGLRAKPPVARISATS